MEFSNSKVSLKIDLLNLVNGTCILNSLIRARALHFLKDCICAQ